MDTEFPSGPQSGSPAPDREDILAVLAGTMHDIEAGLEIDVDATPEAQTLQIKWARALGHLAGQYRLLKRDTDVDEMERELSLVQKAVGLHEDD